MSKEFPDSQFLNKIAVPVIRLYTDGGYSRNRGVGACAFVAVSDGKVIHSDSYTYTKSTSNRMELQAAIEALSWANTEMFDYKPVIITDSKYLDGLPTWSKKWAENGWKTAHGNDVKNLDLVKQYLLAISASNGFSSQWTAGHAGQQFNELADSLVQIAMDDKEDEVHDDSEHWKTVRDGIENRPLWE